MEPVAQPLEDPVVQQTVEQPVVHQEPAPPAQDQPLKNTNEPPSQ